MCCESVSVSVSVQVSLAVPVPVPVPVSASVSVCPCVRVFVYGGSCRQINCASLPSTCVRVRVRVCFLFLSLPTHSLLYCVRASMCAYMFQCSHIHSNEQSKPPSPPPPPIKKHQVSPRVLAMGCIALQAMADGHANHTQTVR